MRNSMKIWINRWFVLRPGKLIYYSSDKVMLKDRCAGILRLADCKVKERYTNKDGFSFKIYHLMHYPIYHKYGLKGETLKFAMLPVSWNYCILRVSSEQERKCWMDAIEEQINYANAHYGSERVLSDSERPDHDSEAEEEEDKKDDKDEDGERKDEIGKVPKVPSTDMKEAEQLEVAENLFGKTEDPMEMQKVFIQNFEQKQAAAIQSIQKKSLKTMQDWKAELDLKLSSLERRVLNAARNKQQQPKISLSFLHLALVILFCLIVGRFV